tara:strand:+ start:1279 stop:2145 length:867 start_codon:yes stop_codon:yes gene_type:complete
MANTTNFAIEKPTVGGYRNSWGGTLNVALDKITELLALALPIGTIQMHTAAAAPTATGNGGTWLICDGTAISRTTYSALFSLIGTTYGVGDGSNTFNVPDLRSRSPIGYNTASLSGRSTRAIAASGGEEAHQLSEGELEQHSHVIPNTTHVHTFTTDDAATDIAETNLAKSNVELNDHNHTFFRMTDYQPNQSTARGDTMIQALNNWREDTHGTTSTKTGASLLKNDGASNNGHKHTLTDPEHQHTGTTGPSLIGITATENTGNNDAHNTMHPYLVVQYIILAKHPTF